MIWFMERETELMICEIRRAEEGPLYEFELAPPIGPTHTQRYESAGQLIDEYLRAQTRLKAQGWRPRQGDIDSLME